MTEYPANGARGRCAGCGQQVSYVCGTNGPGPGTWLHVEAQGEEPAR